jgi:hypothetical protein
MAIHRPAVAGSGDEAAAEDSEASDTGTMRLVVTFETGFRLEMATWSRTIGHEPSEQPAVLCDEAVEGVGYSAAHNRVADRRAVALDEAPAGVALVLRE